MVFIFITYYISTADDVRTGTDQVSQTYEFDCKSGKGDTIEIRDTDAVGNPGHGISEVKVFGTSFPSKSTIIIQFNNINVGVNSQLITREQRNHLISRQ